MKKTLISAAVAVAMFGSVAAFADSNYNNTTNSNNTTNNTTTLDVDVEVGNLVLGTVVGPINSQLSFGSNVGAISLVGVSTVATTNGTVGDVEVSNAAINNNLSVTGYGSVVSYQKVKNSSAYAISVAGVDTHAYSGGSVGNVSISNAAVGNNVSISQ